MTVLITGAGGVLGRELKLCFPDCLSPTHAELDITDKNQIQNYFKNNEFDTIIHAAAMTKVRICEENQNQTWQTNVEGTKNLVEFTSMSNHDINFVYVSTACVFEGKTGMYKESSLPYPENFYALTKLLGESTVSQLTNSLIIRTNFVGREKWPYPKAFTDRFGTYLFSDIVAKGIADVLKNNLQGFVHIVGDKKLSMYELAKLTTSDIEPMTIDDYSGPKLTMDMSLDTEVWKKYTID